MSVLKTELVPKAKPTVAPHPWEKRIKYIYSNSIKCAHNSINNPYYPKRETKEPDEKLHCRYVFTVIGNRSTKEFIYCVKLVQGIYKYRPKIFDPPVVKGVGKYYTALSHHKIYNTAPCSCFFSNMISTNG